MNRLRSNRRFSQKVVWQSASLAVLALFAIGGPALAQTFIEPSTPLGGNTAAPLNSSSTTQRKAGSLLIGPNGATQSKLCLNSSVETGDPQYCITSWAQLQGAYVILQTGVVPPEASAQIGYARVKGATGQGYSLIAEAALPTGTVPSTAAILATDGGNAANFAGYFNGRVYIGDGTGTSGKQLCLNGTDADISDGKGCITSWSAISALVPSGNFVLLQPTPGQTTVQVGGEALTGVGSFSADINDPTKPGGVVIGIPASGTIYTRTCGDGLCSTQTTPAEDNSFCPQDCP